MSDTCVLFFVKYPEPGAVKTRLASVMGAEAAAAMYRHFVQDMLAELVQVKADLRICCDTGTAPCGGDGTPGGQDALAACKAWLGPQHAYQPQQGDDLGERMRTALADAYAAGYERAVVLGSDIPDFPHELAQKALDDLDLHDAVIGPAFDGGYYLIGFRRDRFLPGVFDGMEWSGATVYAATMERLEAARLDVVRLPEWNDVDTMWDLNVLYRTNRNSSFRRSSSYAAMREHDALIRQYDMELPVWARETESGK
ncbi:glycosyltransferase [Desulfovibrio oxamicus]|uniref:Glycosyltransferase n=1 Tax=Nitratidesulfovibrio oxamicus TaxID=32016 RepID=A0ABS0J069_9BACT|nr:TIGR04282 family arsenosugar biosynthesis glycosyltransferase [Nitratidesulfovibrio oxamicus]MBG3875796.1 glycosyltransferase [Nitratidesulfovibrio oxamicus]